MVPGQRNLRILILGDIEQNVKKVPNFLFSDGLAVVVGHIGRSFSLPSKLLASSDDPFQESIISPVQVRGSLFKTLNIQLLTYCNKISNIKLSEHLSHLPNQIPRLLGLAVGAAALNTQHHLRYDVVRELQEFLGEVNALSGHGSIHEILNEAVDLPGPTRKKLPDGSGAQQLGGAQFFDEFPVSVVGSEGKTSVVVGYEVDGNVHITGSESEFVGFKELFGEFRCVGYHHVGVAKLEVHEWAMFGLKVT